MPVGGAGCPFYIECQIERPEKAHTALVGHVCRKECTHNLDPADKNEKVAAGCQQWPCSRPEPGGKGGGATRKILNSSARHSDESFQETDPSAQSARVLRPRGMSGFLVFFRERKRQVDTAPVSTLGTNFSWQIGGEVGHVRRQWPGARKRESEQRQRRGNLCVL